LTHPYASPGVWSLGTMVPGEIVTLTYKATISTNQDAGTYNDLGWAEGTDLLENQVIATQGDPEVFVSTAVAVLIAQAPQISLEENTKTKTKTKTRRVLAATGTSPVWPGIAAILMVIGFNLVMEARKRAKRNGKIFNEMTMKMLIFAIISGAFLFSSAQTKAAVNLAVKMEVPEASVSSPDFKIGFVVLDMSGGTPTVKCQVDNGGGFANFPAAHIEYNSIAGGNSGDCLVDNLVMPLDGTYNFRVVADSINSNEETVNLDTAFPGTPLNYDRGDNSCTASFTTANDGGETVKVELYRSGDLDFIADASTFVTSVAIGSNTQGSITDPLGNCGDYYYAIRAVDANNNGSGFVGDEKVRVRTRTRTRTITEAAGGTIGAIPVATPPAGGAVAGEQVTGGEGTAETAPGGEVLGEQVTGGHPGGIGELFKKYWPWFLAMVIIIIVAYGIFRKREGQENKAE
jgi:hypothetical protein